MSGIEESAVAFDALRHTALAGPSRTTPQGRRGDRKKLAQGETLGTVPSFPKKTKYAAQPRSNPTIALDPAQRMGAPSKLCLGD